MNNPFTLSFGKKPIQYISRITQTNEILDCFTSEIPSNQIYMITGVHGSGKTVMMTNIAAELHQLSDWITVELNPTRDLLQSFTAFRICMNGLLRQNWIFPHLDWVFP